MWDNISDNHDISDNPANDIADLYRLIAAILCQLISDEIFRL